ncbi:MAG: 30S ribosomal protein S21 [Clostridiales bacterium]|jgi:small subunit ribosomal protein S21|nr:30S ribosomal protein S21 [Clostridiales bacterium]
MSGTTIKNNESIDNALKRFKRECQRAGTMAEVRKREHYVPPSLARKKKSEAARKKRKKGRGAGGY